MYEERKNRQLQSDDDIADKAKEGSGDDAEGQVFWFLGGDGQASPS
jgi:hypothetical protein